VAKRAIPADTSELNKQNHRLNCNANLQFADISRKTAPIKAVCCQPKAKLDLYFSSTFSRHRLAGPKNNVRKIFEKFLDR